MKIELPSNELSGALTKVRAAAPGRTTLPILETFLFEVEGSALRITASQADLEASATVACDVMEPGKAAVSANIFGVVKMLGKGAITISIPEVQDARAVIEGKRQRYDFGTLPASDFPLMEPIEIGADFEIDAAALTAAFQATIGTVDAAVGREFLHGIRMYRDGQKLMFFSTDFKRATRFLCDVHGNVEIRDQYTIPAKTASAVVAMLAGYDGTVRIRGNASSISFHAGSSRIVSRLVAGNYGDYSAFVEKVSQYEPGFRVHRSELSEAIARIIALRAETKAPVVVFKTNGEAIELASDRRGRNEGTEHVDAEILAETEFGVSTTFISGLVGVWPENAVLDIAAPIKGGEICIKSGAIPGLMQIVGQMSP